MKTREELITGIRDILTALGVTEFCWYDLNLGWSPILHEGKNSDDTFSLDWIEVNGVSGSSCCDEGFWGWDELSTETIRTIYNQLNEYDTQD